MITPFRACALTVGTACLTLGLLTSTADARVHHRHHTYMTHHKRHAAVHGAMTLRMAQTILSDLGYYTKRIDGRDGPGTRAAVSAFQTEHSINVTGKLSVETAATMLDMVKSSQTRLSDLGFYHSGIDGLIGPHMRLALKAFQKERNLSVTGKLTMETYIALIGTDIPKQEVHQTQDFYATHPDYYGYVDQQYANPLQNGSPQTAPSRFGKLDISEDNTGVQKHYKINMNGQELLDVDGQSSVIGVSKTYSLGDEDIIVLSTYRPDDSLCAYKHYLLVMKDSGYALRDVANCTRGFQAHITGSSFYIVFPEVDDARNVGNTWRYENGDLEKL